MIAFIRGKIVEIGQDHVVIDKAGIGLQVYLNQRDLAGFDEEEATIFTELIVREEELSLYGFLEPMDREIFQRLQRVSGIGVKTALGILSIYSGQEIINFIIEENQVLLTKAPGIGKKTASRMILELKDSFIKDYGLMELVKDEGSEARQELHEALLSLGYGGGEIARATKELDLELPLEQLLRLALSRLVK